MRLSNSKILYWLLLLNPLLSLVFDNTKVYYHYLVYPIIMLLLLMKEKGQGHLFKKSLLVCVCVGMSEIIAIIYGSPLGKLHNHLFNYVDAILLMIFYTRDDNIAEAIIFSKKHLKEILGVVIIINIVEIIMIALHKGFVYIYSWHGTFFSGTNKMPHTLSYLMLAVIIFNIVYMVLSHRKYACIWAIVPTYCVFISGARVSLLLCIILDAIILSYVFSEKKRNLFIKLIRILPIILLSAFLLKDKILESDLMAKIVSRSDSGNNTAGRTYIWIDLTKRFIINGNPLYYLFGMGDDKSYYFNSINPLVKSEVWAHNDIIQILIGKGIIGVSIYLIYLTKFFKKLIRRSGNIYTYAIICFVIVGIVFNGFYSYRDVNLCIPFLMVINEIMSYKTDKFNYMRWEG